MNGFLTKTSRENRATKFSNNSKRQERSRDHSKGGYGRKERSSWKQQVRY